ncbi:DNA glycosylase [Wallemia mellicola]|uniref:DNA-(apurinic or apyrimidinic site) lyase n=1 Tax=Wallemia mellicola TaxID=1708541 RepID=A0A4T0U561_9BASI|nr:hypothetical protein E3Q23_03541 [Wallemia mellicola]TIB76192.1 DNA glycosylase [Wallemia mellicola]TIB87858.1 DNA glycosylase [Wallemia mellicola]TIC08975.1 DNA glycosylase [Wallemia mellicola]TIC09470.1 DNA glycosylase [Wallemia mellicola]
MKYNKIKDFNINISIVLKCGQSFRWMHNSTTNEFSLALNDRTIILKQDNVKELDFRSIPSNFDSDKSFIHDYFQLDTRIIDLYDDWSARDRHFKSIKDTNKFDGILILRQDPWECLISFICSSNNNIARISQMITKLSTTFSEPLGDLDEIYSRYPFPPPSKLAGEDVEDTLRTLGFGYRAKYVANVAKMLVEEHGSDENIFTYLHSLRKESYENVIPQLTRMMGVGPKVADCVALMSLDQHSSIPVDTHVWQIAVRDYGFLKSPYVKSCKGKVSQSSAMSPSIYAAVGKMFRDLWGPYAGWAHTVLFAADLKAFKEESPSVKDENDVVPGVVTSVVSPEKKTNVRPKRVVDSVKKEPSKGVSESNKKEPSKRAAESVRKEPSKRIAKSTKKEPQTTDSRESSLSPPPPIEKPRRTSTRNRKKKKVVFSKDSDSEID